ncbi:hypothetical protein C8Q69DRAFT_402995 [Paecilomyces variotii]|uniref:Methyltransferase type 11 domain-containing protein n=1 Tax=Byssochlamys spectabilis TaxID=264951 RepID=A0A443HTD4_BYSSP|nr:hypothetical protein C8Q69DRAFT_402995 [Paecilomyces variotii]RWQ95081.1 hypothetical protein C8Q69DRAFT_402995 [Paecilomyces variotii]
MASSEVSNSSTKPHENSEAYEEEHVHQVYQQIAQHFSATRYKPWPVVERFLKEQTPGSIGLDIGCGNGKYLTVNPDVFILGISAVFFFLICFIFFTSSCFLFLSNSIMSPVYKMSILCNITLRRARALARIAIKHQPHSTILADILDLPHPYSRFDFAISIAVIHHLSTPERRVRAIAEILQTLKPTTNNSRGGTALVYVWALEQKESRRGWDKGDQQDIMVPWVLKQKPTESGSNNEQKVFHRYYHLYESGELERDICSAGGKVLDSGYDKDNWWAIATRSPET